MRQWKLTTPTLPTNKKIMSENEKLNEINTLIEFNIEDLGFRYYSNTFVEHEEVWYRIVKVREIIFTPEFLWLYTSFLWKNYLIGDFEYELLSMHLDDPLQYLYNTLKLWVKKH